LCAAKDITAIPWASQRFTLSTGTVRISFPGGFLSHITLEPLLILVVCSRSKGRPLLRSISPRIELMRAAFIAFLVLSAAGSIGIAQGTFQYDQQSLNHSIGANVLYNIQPNGPMGQSFTPSLPSVGFVQFELYDGHPNNGLGATLYVNLRSNSISGLILSSTDPVFLPEIPSGGGVASFLFSTPAAVVPGTTYFFEVVVQSGDLWRLNVLADLYGGGTLLYQGAAQPLEDSWFREGIIVPEPSTVALLITAGALFCVRRKK